MADRIRTGDLDWEDLRFFTALARHGSLSATARALRVNHATVSRRISTLETALGVTLFDRCATGYVLSAEGKAVLRETRPMEEAALDVLRLQDRGGPVRSLVRLTTTRILADAFLVERLGDFHRLHPGIDIELLTGSREFSVARREADIALRFGALRDSALVSRTLATVRHAFYGTPAWQERIQAGGAPTLVGFDTESKVPTEAKWLAMAFPECRVSFRSNGWAAQAMAARAGFGIALLPCWLASTLSGLVPVSLGPEPPVGSLTMLVRPDLVESPRIRATADHLVSVFAAARAIFDGTTPSG
jgi:DNA-binding transcriptional LysR family regulator